MKNKYREILDKYLVSENKSSAKFIPEEHLKCIIEEIDQSFKNEKDDLIKKLEGKISNVNYGNTTLDSAYMDAMNEAIELIKMK